MRFVSVALDSHRTRELLLGQRSQVRIALDPPPHDSKPPQQLPDGRVRFVSDPYARRCPYAPAGTFLVVHEPWAKDFEIDRRGRETGHVFTLYRADFLGDRVPRLAFAPKWKEAFEMPREVSRLTLRVREVRIERLDEISDWDARCEGFESAQAYFDAIGIGENPTMGALNDWYWVLDVQAYRQNYQEIYKKAQKGYAAA